jgi:hypothetical protein
MADLAHHGDDAGVENLLKLAETAHNSLEMKPVAPPRISPFDQRLRFDDGRIHWET